MSSVTIYDIAQALNISPSTVNRSLTGYPGVKESTRELVLNTAQKMGYSRNRAASILSRHTVKICAILYDAVPDFTLDIKRGIEAGFQKVKEANTEGYLFLLPRSITMKEYTKQLEKIVQDHEPNALIILPPGPGFTAEMTELINRYDRDGISVITLVSDCPASNRVFNVTRNGRRCGAFAAELLDHMLNKDAPVAIITTSKDETVHAETIEGFVSYAESAQMNYIGAFEHYDDPEIAYHLADIVLKRIPNIGGLYFNSVNSTSFCKRLKELGRIDDLRIITTEYSPSIGEMLRNSDVDFSIFSDPFLQGKKSVEKLAALLTDGTIPKDSAVIIEPQIIMKSNLEVFAERITETEEPNSN